MTRVARKLSQSQERVRPRRLRRVRRQTLAGAIVGAIVAVALMMFSSAPAKASPPNDEPRLATTSLTR